MAKFIEHSTIFMVLTALFFCLFTTNLWAANEDAPPSVEPEGSAVITFSPEEKEYIQTHPTIRVSNEFDWPPFDFAISGSPQGFGIDLMELLSKRAGLHFEYVNGFTWDELVKMFNDGEIDVIHSLSITPERAEKAFFSPPYYHSKNVLILRRDTPDTNELSDLEHKIIALPKGWSSIQFFQKYYPGVHIIEVESSRETLEYVDQGKVFATVEQEGIARYFIKKFGFHDLKTSKWIDNDELQKTSSMHFAVLKDKPVLFNILRRALATIQPEDMARLESKWFSREGREIGSEDVGLTPSEWEYLKSRERIRFCIDPDRMPLEGFDGQKISGMTVDFLELFSERLGTVFELVPTGSWSATLDQVQDGNCDIVPMVNKTATRETFMDFTSSYLDYGMAIITGRDSHFVTGLNDFSGKIVGIPKGSFLWEIETTRFPEVSFVHFNDVEQCLMALAGGRIDGALLSLPVATYHIRSMGLSSLKVAGYSGIKDVIRIGVKKNDPQLHSIMSKLVRAMPVKDVDKIYKKWISLTFADRFDYSLLWKIGGGVVLVLILVLAWNYQLMRLNREIGRAHQELEKKSGELERLAVTDSLTGLNNRRYIQQILEKERVRHLRYQRPFSVILSDLDHFKEVNDRYGHQTGDIVLIRFAGLLKSVARESDVPGRWGGEEFLVICPESDLIGASTLAENLRKSFSELDFPTAGQRTASFGVACFRDDESVESLLHRADTALYAAKEKGRNRVEVDG